MKTVAGKILDLSRLTLNGHGNVAIQALKARMYRDSVSLGLCRDLRTPFAVPAAKVVTHIRPLLRTDDLSFLNDDAEPASELLTRVGQLRMLKADLPTCYVAVLPDGKIGYMQWLIGASENEKIMANFGEQFPSLQCTEALLEGAFTVPAYRGLGIMANAMAQIAERAINLGAHRVITFVGKENGASLKGCERAGFSPYVTRHESWRLFRRKINFVAIAEQPVAVERTTLAS
ncbi:MAG TPA: GNAT family N-acetyltransferase [Terriglobales bacterium]|nr:GNAT family N-acetyltransferase [Terriglobales bacterium]